MSDRDDELFLVDDDDEDTLANKYILFLLGDESYGINIAYVTDIIELQRITEVPDMPDYVKGVINLRGKVIPVLDLRLRFGMGEREYDDRTCVIIVRLKEISVGFIVDIVSEVHVIPEKSIDPPPAFKAGSGGKKENYIKGLGKVGEEVKILIDVEKLVDDEEMSRVKDEAS